MKIAGIQDISILNGAPVHNLGEERSVGMINHELEIRGKKHFNTSSQNLVLNNSVDLTSKCFSNYRKFKRPADDIKELKLEWNKKMNDLEKEGLGKQEVAALAQENKKLKDLAFLKTQNPPGPFSCSEDVDKFMQASTEPLRNKRLYHEVRYAKYSTSNMKRTSIIFRLKKNAKNLDSEEYAHNLKTYFGCANSVQSLTLADLSLVLTGLSSANQLENLASVYQSSLKKFCFFSYEIT